MVTVVCTAQGLSETTFASTKGCDVLFHRELYFRVLASVTMGPSLVLEVRLSQCDDG